MEAERHVEFGGVFSCCEGSGLKKSPFLASAEESLLFWCCFSCADGIPDLGCVICSHIWVSHAINLGICVAKQNNHTILCVLGWSLVVIRALWQLQLRRLVEIVVPANIEVAVQISPCSRHCAVIDGSAVKGVSGAACVVSVVEIPPEIAHELIPGKNLPTTLRVEQLTINNVHGATYAILETLDEPGYVVV